MIKKLKHRIGDKYNGYVREKAIAEAKSKMALSGKEISEYTDEEKEVIVRNEENKIKGNHVKGSFITTLLVVLGLS